MFQKFLFVRERVRTRSVLVGDSVFANSIVIVNFCNAWNGWTDEERSQKSAVQEKETSGSDQSADSEG